MTTPPEFTLDRGEVIRFQTPANHFKGIEAVGGFLCLTDKGLLFESHSLNIQRHKLAINISDLTHVNRYKTLDLLNNGLAISLTGSKEEKFVVEKAKQWVEKKERRTAYNMPLYRLNDNHSAFVFDELLK